MSEATVLAALERSRDAYAEKLAELAEAPGHKITHREAGRTMNWQEYQQFLIEKIREIETEIERYKAPAYEVSVAITGGGTDPSW